MKIYLDLKGPGFRVDPWGLKPFHLHNLELGGYSVGGGYIIVIMQEVIRRDAGFK